MSEKNMEEKLLKLSSKLENFTNTEKYEADLNKIKHTENKLSKKMSQLEKQIWDELEKMQDEYQSGEQVLELSQEHQSFLIQSFRVFYFELMAREQSCH